MIRLAGHIDVPAARLESIRAALAEHIALTRAEPGCIAFDVTEAQDVPGRFMVTELFTNQAAFDAHQTRAGASDWARISAGIPRSYHIEETEA